MERVKRKRQQYSPTKMATAIEYVRGGMPKRRAAKLCGVPRTTLLDKLYGRVPEEHTKPGSKTILTSAEEDVLVNYLKLMADVGYPVSRLELKTEVKKLLDRDGRNTPFNNNMPGNDWYDGFCRRHQEIKERKPQALGRERAIISFEMIEQWFDTLQSYLKKEIKDHEMLVQDPRRIFNADESGFPLCATTSRVLAPTGAKHVYQVVANDKTQITVMACLNANGDYMPPMIVYPGQRFRAVGIDKFPGAIYGHSDKGWMDSELFVQFLHEFVTFVKSKAISFPVLLFVDGHSTHLSLEAAQFCRDNGVILYCLLPNATHILQACDIGLFSPMKAAWKAQLKAWQMENIGCIVTKSVFPGLFRVAWERVATLQNASQGFKRSGLFPLRSDNVDKSKLGPSKLLSPPKEMSSPSGSSAVTSQNLEHVPGSDLDHTYAVASSCSPSSAEVNCTSDSGPNIIVLRNNTRDFDFHCPLDITVNAREPELTNCSASFTTGGISADESMSDQLFDCDIISHSEVIIGNDLSCEVGDTQIQSNNLTVSQFEQATPVVTNSSTTTPSEMLSSVANPGVLSVSSRVMPTQRSPLQELNSNNSATRKCSSLALPPAKNPKQPGYISPVFNLLTIPEIKQKSKRKTVREKLPKAVSGHEAIKMLKDREEKKKNEERLKKERKAERERKKIEREILKESKRKEREEKKAMREAIKKAKQCKKKQSKRKAAISESSSEEEQVKITYADSDDDFSDFEPTINCTACKSHCRVDIPRDWAACVICDRKWHVACTDNLVLQSLTVDELSDHDYYCEECVY